MPPKNPQLSLYLPRTLLAWQAESPGANRLDVDGTAVFADISGFTPMVEAKSAEGQHGAEEVTDTLNRVFTEMLGVASEDGGDVLKFGGDAFLLLFSGPEHTERAARSALDIEAVLAEGKVPGLGISIGLDSGRLHLLLAGDDHRELIVFGPAVNGALEAEAAAATGCVLAGETAAEDLGPEYVDAEGRLVSAPEPDLYDPPVPPAGNELDLADYVPSGLRPLLTVGGFPPEHRAATIGFIHLPIEDSERVGEDLDVVTGTVQAAAARHGVTFLSTDVAPDGLKIILVSGVPAAARHEEEAVLRTCLRVIETDLPVPVRAGVAQGQVFAADLGAPFRRSMTVIGDTVNLAARLMGVAPSGRLVTTRRVLERSPTRFRLERLPPVSLKGKSRPVVPIAVGSIIGVEHPDRIGKVPLIGRDAEMEILSTAVDGLTARRGGVVELVGEPGVGRSRLIEETRALVRSADVYTLVCERYEHHTPYYTAGHLLRGAVGLDPDADPDTVRGRLLEIVEDLAPPLRPWAPLLGIPLDIPVEPTPETADLADEYRGTRMHDVCAEFLRAVVPGPVAIVVENAHWIDAASHELIARVLERNSDLPWLTLVARRAEGTWTPVDGARQLPIEALDESATQELLRRAARDRPVSDHDLTRIAARSEGNPLFALELLHAGAGGTLPETVKAVIAERIDRLDARDRQFLRYAAVFGSRFSLDLLAEALPAVTSTAEDTETLERLAAFLEVSLFGDVQFRSSLIRTVAYEGLPYRDRRRVHALAAEAIERRARRRPERHAPLLALHHQEAANWEQAWRFGVIAAEQAASRWAPSEATDLYLRALRIDPAEVADDERQRAAEALGEAALLAGRYEDSDFGYGLALDPAEPGSLDAIRINRKRAALIRTRGDLAEAVELLTGLEAGLTDVEAAAARQERVAVRISLAGALQRQGEYARCADLCLAAVEEAEKIGDEKALAHGCFLMITTNLALGRDDERDYAAVALDIYERLGDLVGQGDVLNNSGMRSYYRGDWDTTVREWELSRDAYRRAGYATGAATADNNLAEVLSDQGHLDRAEERFRDALRAYEAAGFSIGIALARSNLGRLAGRRGRLDEALEWLRSGRASFDELGAQSYATEADVRIAEAFAFAGRCSDAEAALAEIPKADVPGLEALIDRIRACTAARSGDLETAAGLLRDSAEAARTADVPFELGLTLDALARFDADPAVSAEAGEILGRLGAEDAIRLPWPQGMPATPE